jgi:protein phosphatase
VEADVTEAAPEPGDVWLLCSDGLSDLVEDEEMRAAVRAHADPDEACRVLVERANYRGGDDNITVLIVHARAGAPARRFPRLRGLFGE